MNVFKKISLKYFNGSSNLNEGEERDIITSRDKAFIYACRKYNIDFEYYNFFSGAHFVEESDFEPEHSLIKCNFSELKKYNHFKWFAYLLSSQLDKERIPQFKAVLKLLERKREPYFYAVIEAIEKGLKENRQNISVYVNVKGNLWDSGMKYAISKPIHITILWNVVDKTLDHIFYEIPAKVEENIRKAQEAARKAQREWEERMERERKERERIRQENAYQRARFYGSQGFEFNDDFAGFNHQYQSWWDNFSREQAKRQQETINPYASLYTILQISPTTDKKIIKAAYKKLVLVYHPDRGGSEEKFKELTAAYEKLMSL